MAGYNTLHDLVQPMNFIINKCALTQIRENSRQVARAFNELNTGHTNIYPHLFSNNMSQGRFTKPGTM